MLLISWAVHPNLTSHTPESDVLYRLQSFLCVFDCSTQVQAFKVVIFLFFLFAKPLGGSFSSNTLKWCLLQLSVTLRMPSFILHCYSFFLLCPLFDLPFAVMLGRGFEVILEFESMRGASKFSISWKSCLCRAVGKTVSDNKLLFMVYVGILCHAQPTWSHLATPAQWTGLIEVMIHLLPYSWRSRKRRRRENSSIFVELLLCLTFFWVLYVY